MDAAVQPIFKFPADIGHVTITYGLHNIRQNLPLAAIHFIHVLPAPPLLLFPVGSTDVGFFASGRFSISSCKVFGHYSFTLFHRIIAGKVDVSLWETPLEKLGRNYIWFYFCTV